MAPLDQELPNEKNMGFLDHLEELRGRLFKSILAVIVAASFLFIKKDLIFDDVLFGPRDPEFISYKMWCEFSKLFGQGNSFCVTEIKYELKSLTMLGNFSAHCLISMIGGVIISFPVIMYQVWAFIKPALKRKKKSLLESCLLLINSFLFRNCIWILLVSPLSLQFLGSYELGTGENNVAVEAAIMSYVSTITSITFAAGLIFQLPILIFFLSKVGIVTAPLLRKYRRHALVGILVLSALITPPDITSQVLVSIPVLFLYELSIIIAKRQDRKREKRNKK